MRATILVLVTLFVMGPADVWAAKQKSVTTEVEAKALRAMAATIPLGSRVKAQTTSGTKLNGVLMSVTDDAVIIKKRTRLEEPAVTVPFTELTRLELQINEGMSAAKIIGIGLATGAGAILTLLAFAFAIDD